MFDAFVKSGLDLFKWLGLGGKPKSVRKPDGYTRTTGPYGEVVDCDTLQCAHCGAHWEVVVGSGRLRGTCSKCLGYVCGQPACMAGCSHPEQKLENLEKGLPRLFVPTRKVFGELGPRDIPPGGVILDAEGTRE